MEKLCSNCFVSRSISEYIGKRGELRMCIKCRARSNRSRLKHRDERIIDNILWKEENKEHVREYAECYRKGEELPKIIKVKRIAKNRIQHAIIDNIEKKYCSKCDSWYELDFFQNRSCTWDGKKHICKECCKSDIKK